MSKHIPIKSKVRKQKNPVFYFNNDKENEIKAGGVLFYFYDKKKNTLKFLMINNRNKYEDFGGKTDRIDKNIISTVSREVEEESNCIFSKKSIFNRIKNMTPIYTKNSKYVIYFCKLSDSEDYNPEIFGQREIYENILRTIEWIPYNKLRDNEFIKNKLNFRLKFSSFFTKIKKLHKRYCGTTKSPDAHSSQSTVSTC